MSQKSQRLKRRVAIEAARAEKYEQHVLDTVGGKMRASLAIEMPDGSAFNFPDVAFTNFDVQFGRGTSIRCKSLAGSRLLGV